MIREICEAIHRILPRPGQPTVTIEYTRAVAAAVAFVEFVTKRNLVHNCEWEQSIINGRQMLCFKIKAHNTAVNDLLAKLFENYALFSLSSITQTLERSSIASSTCVFHFASYEGLQLTTGINFADDCTDHDAYADNLSAPLDHIIVELLNVHALQDKVHHYSIRWFADRLPCGEVQGPHMLALQNFLYRRA